MRQPHLLNPVLFCGLRTTLAVMNAGVLVCSLVTHQSLKSHLFWELKLPC